MKSYQNHHFESQEEGEKILLIVRRHWFDILLQYIPVLSLVMLIFTAVVAVAAFFPEILSEYATISYFVLTLAMMFIWMMIFIIWIDYYLDVWILTNIRVVNIEQKGLFLRYISELRYHTIQDVTTEVEGFFPTMLNYGEVFVQTAAEQSRFLFHNVPRPNKIKEKIVDLQKRARKNDIGNLEQLIRKSSADVEEGAFGR